MMTLVFAFPGLMNVGALLLVMFMFAVFGMNVFTYLAHGDAINEDATSRPSAMRCCCSSSASRATAGRR